MCRIFRVGESNYSIINWRGDVHDDAGLLIAAKKNDVIECVCELGERSGVFLVQLGLLRTAKRLQTLGC